MQFLRFSYRWLLRSSNMLHSALWQRGTILWGGRDSLVCIATRYGLDSPWIESQLGQDFPHPSWPALGPTQPLYIGYRAFLVGKAAAAWRWPPTPSITEVKERVELYLYSPYGFSWPVLGCTLPLPLQYFEGKRCFQLPLPWWWRQQFLAVS